MCQYLGGIAIKEVDVVKKDNKTIIFENTYDSETEEELNEKVKQIIIDLINS